MTSSLLEGGAAASAEAAGGARGGAEEAEGGEPQQSRGRRERWEPSGNIVSGLLILQTSFEGLDK